MATENDFGTDALGSRPTTSPVRTSLTCVYIYPSKDEQRDARVESWVTAARRARPRRVARGLELARYRLAVQEPGVRAAPLTGSPARVSVGVGSRRWRVGSTDSYGWYRSTANDACGPPEPATPEHTTDPSDWIATLHAESKPDVRFVVTVPSPPKVGSGVPSAR